MKTDEGRAVELTTPHSSLQPLTMRAGSMVLVNWPQVDSSCLELAPRKARFGYTLVFRATSTTKMIPNLMEISLDY